LYGKERGGGEGSLGPPLRGGEGGPGPPLRPGPSLSQEKNPRRGPPPYHPCCLDTFPYRRRSLGRAAALPSSRSCRSRLSSSRIRCTYSSVLCSSIAPGPRPAGQGRQRGYPNQQVGVRRPTWGDGGRQSDRISKIAHNSRLVMRGPVAKSKSTKTDPRRRPRKRKYPCPHMSEEGVSLW